jgi:hypothetical protein
MWQKHAFIMKLLANSQHLLFLERLKFNEKIMVALKIKFSYILLF